MLTDLDEPARETRRDEILGSMLRAAAARRRRRTVRNASLMSLPLAFAGAVLWVSVRGPVSPTSPGTPVADARDGISAPVPPPAVTREESSNAVDRARAIVERRISDEELAGLLRESGAEMGLVRVGHEVRLVPWNLRADEGPDAPEDPRPTTGDAAS